MKRPTSLPFLATALLLLAVPEPSRAAEAPPPPSSSAYHCQDAEWEPYFACVLDRLLDNRRPLFFCMGERIGYAGLYVAFCNDRGFDLIGDWETVECYGPHPRYGISNEYSECVRAAIDSGMHCYMQVATWTDPESLWAICQRAPY